MKCHSFDSAVDDPHNYYPSEFLNTLTPNGLPPHVLKLKSYCFGSLILRMAYVMVRGWLSVVFKDIVSMLKLCWANIVGKRVSLP